MDLASVVRCTLTKLLNYYDTLSSSLTTVRVHLVSVREGNSDGDDLREASLLKCSCSFTLTYRQVRVTFSIVRASLHRSLIIDKIITCSWGAASALFKLVTVRDFRFWAQFVRSKVMEDAL